jgi:hypothetical protein
MSYSAREVVRINYGMCSRCGEPRGRGGTDIYCRSCARSRQAIAERALQKALGKGLCSMCRSPRGEDGTARYCRKCANRRIAYMQRRRKTRKSEKLCPDHGVPVGKYKYCVRCRNRPISDA